MGDGRGPYPAILKPRPSIENAREQCQQYIAPIEVDCAFVEVGKPKQGGGDEQRAYLPNPPLEKILHPSAKEKLFRNGNKEEGEDPSQENMPKRRHMGVEMEEPEEQPEGNSDGSVHGQPEQANAEVTQTKAEVETNLAQLPDGEKAIDARIEQQNFIENGETRSPGRFKPAQVHGQTEDAKDEEVAPFSSLLRVAQACAVEQQADEDGEQRVEGKPCPSEKAVRKRDQGIGETEQSGRQDAQAKRPSMRQLADCEDRMPPRRKGPA